MADANDQRRALRKETQLNIKSPVCEFQFPSLGTPKKGGEYDGLYGKYKLTLVLDTDIKEHVDFIDKLKERYDLALSKNPAADSNDFPITEQKVKAKYLPNYKLGPGEDDDTPILTGKMVLTITEKGGHMNDAREDVFHSVYVCGPDNVEYTKQEKDALWSGTTGEVVISTYAYYEAKKTGLSVRFKAVRIKDARTAGGNPNPNELFGPAWSGENEDEESGSF
jgi:hypothetical protein